MIWWAPQVWDGAYETYVEDEEMANKLRKNNPQAFSNVVRSWVWDNIKPESGAGGWALFVRGLCSCSIGALTSYSV